jgi:ferredoxin
VTAGQPPPEQAKVFVVDARCCIRCGACATVARGLFNVEGPVAKGPGRALTGAETRLCQTAVLLCPTSSIQATVR